MQRREALFVVNQDVSPLDLRAVCDTEGIRSALVLTTHRVFPPEWETLRQVAADVEVVSFADVLSEADMCHCDDTAERLLLHERSRGEEGYASRFMALSIHEKNRIVHERLLTLYQFRAVHYRPGLGVAASYWKDVDAAFCMRIHTSEIKDITKQGGRRYLKPMQEVIRISREFLTPAEREVRVIRDGGKTYAFLSQLKRLRIRPETLVETEKCRTRSMKTVAASEPAKSLVRHDSAALSRSEHRSGNDTLFCMTIHDYDLATAEALGGVLVFVDGYHPSNYPRSYLDSYGDDIFVVRTMFDESWFKTSGKRTIKPPAFLEREHFASCVITRATRVLVALTHAGDWTALINRSDTDDLVTATVNMAHKLPQLSFRIRMHPTMSHPAHEGVHSSERIKELVRSANLANLHTSTLELSEDLAWCEICLSEYSQVLLDALRMGKLGVSVNLTRRRSFMQDYSDLGFFHACSFEEALALLRRIVEGPRGASSEQNRAVVRYNALFVNWLGERL